MVIEYIRYEVPEAERAAFIHAYDLAASELSGSPHCLRYEVSQGIEEPGNFTVRIEWDSVEGHEQGFRKSAAFATFLAKVKPFIGMIREMKHYRAHRQGVGGVPTLFEWLGGLPALQKLLERFYGRVPEDPLLAPVFAGMSPHHVEHVADFLAEVFGGPRRYSAEHGGHAAMIRRHLGRNLSEAHRRRWMQLLLECADELALPDDPEFRSAFVAYLEWGTRLAAMNSQPGAEAVEDAPMPAWSWGAVRGPYVK
jgi:truncated hemoglobin YjbI/quinol monooxygenase YgiN